MAITVTHRYDYKLGPIEQVAVEVLNDRYGRITKRRWHTAREYAIELATLLPDPIHNLYLAWRWLAASGGALLVMLGFIAYLKFSSNEPSLLVTAGTIAALLALTALFLYLFVILSKRRIIFHARYSGTPLVEIPIPLRNRHKGNSFATEFSHLVQSNLARLTRLDHTDQDLRAGELRMLRRLSEEGAIARATYDKAKQLLLRASD